MSATTMRAFVVTAPGEAGVQEVGAPVAQPGEVVIDVESPSLIDTRALALKDVTAVGVLSASPGLAGTIDLYARGDVDPRPLIAATVGLGEVAAVLAGDRPAGAGAGPKIHVDPRP